MSYHLCPHDHIMLFPMRILGLLCEAKATSQKGSQRQFARIARPTRLQEKEKATRQRKPWFSPCGSHSTQESVRAAEVLVDSSVVKKLLNAQCVGAGSGLLPPSNSQHGCSTCQTSGTMGTQQMVLVVLLASKLKRDRVPQRMSPARMPLPLRLRTHFPRR